MAMHPDWLPRPCSARATRPAQRPKPWRRRDRQAKHKPPPAAARSPSSPGKATKAPRLPRPATPQKVKMPRPATTPNAAPPRRGKHRAPWRAAVPKQRNARCSTRQPRCPPPIKQTRLQRPPQAHAPQSKAPAQHRPNPGSAPSAPPPAIAQRCAACGVRYGLRAAAWPNGALRSHTPVRKARSGTASTSPTRRPG